MELQKFLTSYSLLHNCLNTQDDMLNFRMEYVVYIAGRLQVPMPYKSTIAGIHQIILRFRNVQAEFPSSIAIIVTLT